MPDRNPSDTEAASCDSTLNKLDPSVELLIMLSTLGPLIGHFSMSLQGYNLVFPSLSMWCLTLTLGKWCKLFTSGCRLQDGTAFCFSSSKVRRRSSWNGGSKRWKSDAGRLVLLGANLWPAMSVWLMRRTGLYFCQAEDWHCADALTVSRFKMTEVFSITLPKGFN